MPGATHDHGSKVESKLSPRTFQTFQSACKIFVGFAHTGILILGCVAAQHKKATTFHRGLLKNVGAQCAKAALNQEKGVEVPKDEIVLPGQE